MSYGTLFQPQAALLQAFVKDQEILDLGAGDLGLAKHLIVLGAKHILALDKEPRKVQSKQITYKCGYFADHTGNHTTAFMSWPPNHRDPGLVRLVAQIPTFIYLGKNTDGSACGGPDLFNHLRQREVLLYVPYPKNVLIVYGPKLVERPLRGEELAAISQYNYEPPMRYEEAEARSAVYI